MSAALIERVPVAEITGRARDVRFGPSLLALIGFIFIGLGWLAAKFFAILWLCLTWSWAAMVVGWRQGHGQPETRQSRKDMADEIEWLRNEVQRLSG